MKDSTQKLKDALDRIKEANDKQIEATKKLQEGCDKLAAAVKKLKESMSKFKLTDKKEVSIPAPVVVKECEHNGITNIGNNDMWRCSDCGKQLSLREWEVMNDATGALEEFYAPVNPKDLS